MSTPWRRIPGMDLQLHLFITSALERDEYWNSHLSRFGPGKEQRVPFG